MISDINIIEEKYIFAKEEFERINNLKAIDYKSSLFYQKDILDTIPDFSVAILSITRIKNNAKDILNKIDNVKTGFYHTRQNLIEFNSSINENILSDILKFIEEESTQIFTNLSEIYDNNKKAGLSLLDSCLNSINLCKTYEKKYTAYKSRYNEALKMEDSEEKNRQLKVLSNQIDTMKDNANLAINKIKTFLKEIETINEQNNELLERGLKKV